VVEGIVLTGCCISTGYKLGEKKTAEELAALDAEDESLAKWKASLGIGAGGSAHAPVEGPQVRLRFRPCASETATATPHRIGPMPLIGSCCARADTAFYE